MKSLVVSIEQLNMAIICQAGASHYNINCGPLQMLKTINEYLDDYNQVNTTQMHLVLFIDAVKHLCRICRIIRQPLGNGLLLGVGGSGRQSLTRLAAHM